MFLPVLTALIGALAAGAWAHRLALRRERRAEVTRVVDRAIEAYTGADRALAFLGSRVFTERTAEEVQAAAELVTDREIEIRAARFSLSLRLHEGHPLELAFGKAHGTFTATYHSLGPAIFALAKDEWNDDADAALREYEEWQVEFRVDFSAAVDEARSVVGQLGRKPRRRNLDVGEGELDPGEAGDVDPGGEEDS